MHIKLGFPSLAISYGVLWAPHLEKSKVTHDSRIEENLTFRRGLSFVCSTPGQGFQPLEPFGSQILIFLTYLVRKSELEPRCPQTFGLQV